MKVFRPGLPPVFTDEDAPSQPAPPKVVKPDTKANPFITPEEAIRAAQARHIAAHGALPQQPAAPVAPPAPPVANTTQTAPSPNPGASGAPATTEIIPPVAPQPLIDNNKPPATPPPAPKQPEQEEINTSPELTPEEEAELDALLAKRDHTEPHEGSHSP